MSCVKTFSMDCLVAYIHIRTVTKVFSREGQPRKASLNTRRGFVTDRISASELDR